MQLCLPLLLFMFLSKILAYKTPLPSFLIHVPYRSFGVLRRPHSTRKPKGFTDPRLVYSLDHHCLSGLPDKSKPFTVLGIETSCDDTGVSIVRSNGEILSNVVFSQYEIHQKFGGVVPMLALNAHKDNIEKALSQALVEAGMNSIADVDAIAVTRGPGLEVCLRIGFEKGKELAVQFNKPFVSINHLEAHCMITRLAGVDQELQYTDFKQESEKPLDHFTPRVSFPFLTLLVSGGHTSLLLTKGLGDHTVLGSTLDDALGEAFDKAARLLGLTCESSGGRAVEEAAERAVRRAKELDEPLLTFESTLKVPMRDKVNCDFSYAGLKNAFRLTVANCRADYGLDSQSTNAPSHSLHAVDDIVTLPPQLADSLCYAFQQVAFKHIEERVRRALDVLEKTGVDITALVVVGGVASNLVLRRTLKDLLDSRAAQVRERADYRRARHAENVLLDRQSVDERRDPSDIRLIFPPLKLCTDNGAMVAWTAVEKLSMGISDSPVTDLVTARWPIGALLDDESLFAGSQKNNRFPKKHLAFM